MVALSNAQIGQVIHELSNAPGPEEACRLLRAHPWLTLAQVDDKLTQVIANKRHVNDLPGVALFVASRGLLRRCQSEGVDAALTAQPGWPLSTQSPLAQLLALDETAPPDSRIERAIAALRDVEPETEPDIYGLIHYHLGMGYQAKANADSTDAFAPAIEHFEVAVQAWLIEGSLFGKEFIGRAQHNLGHLYLHRRHGRRSQDVETALRWLDQALKASGKESVEHLNALILLGDAYLDRVREERLENVERAIDYYRQAHLLAEKTQDASRLGQIEHNLATAYRVRLLGSRADNYERARQLAQRALNRFDREESPEDWARTAAELATILAHRQYGDGDDNLEAAIEYARQALEIYTPEAHPRQWRIAQLNLGNLYCDRISGLRVDNERQAIRCFRAVLGSCDRETDPLRWAEAMNNLGTVYASRSVSASDADYEEAIKCFRQALEVRKPDTLPAQALQTATNLGNLEFRFGKWAAAETAFQTALKAGEALYQASITEAGRRVEIAETSRLYGRAAYCLLQQRQPAQSLLRLEQGKARLLAEALALGEADLSILSASQRQEMLEARHRVRELEADMRLPPDTPARPSDRQLAQDLRQARADLDGLINAIRAEHPDFMASGLDLAGILAQIPRGGALVAPLVTSQGSVAFVLPDGAQTVGPEHVVPLDGFTDDDLNDLLIGSEDRPGWMRSYIAWRDDSLSQDAWEAAIETITHSLWNALMAPVHNYLISLGLAEAAPVTLIPQGGLGLLPLHVAWRRVDGRKRFFLDDYTVSYAPSAYTLSVAHQRLQDERRHQLSLLAVVNPTGNLPYTPIECHAIAELFPLPAQLMLIGSDATPEAVVREAPGRTYLHFACHGSYGWRDVMSSALILAEEYDFTLSEVMSELDLETARLVTLSACETGLTEFQQSPDEYIGLPAGFLWANVPTVVASLWAVDDLSTALLMERFYHHHLVDGLGVAAALRMAQRWLRDLPNDKARQQLNALRHVWRAREEAALEKGDSAEAGYAHTQHERLWEDMAQIEAMGPYPFTHPFCWGAFQAVGAVQTSTPSSRPRRWRRTFPSRSPEVCILDP